MMNTTNDKMNAINTKTFGLNGAIQGAKEAIGLYADGSETLEAQMAKGLWYLLDNHQQILSREFPSIGEDDEPLARTMEREAEKRESPMEREVNRAIAEQSTPNDFNARYAKLDMLDKGTLIGELIRWTDTAKREHARAKELADLLPEANTLIGDTKKVIGEVMTVLG